MSKTWTAAFSFFCATMVAYGANAQADLAALPDAQPGECFAKVLEPAKYKDVEQTVVTREAAAKIEVIPAKYQTVEETVVVRPAYQKVVPVPAKMKTVTETVTIEPARLVWRVGAGKSAIAKELTVANALAAGLPATAQAGQCYAQFFQPAQYEDRSNEIVVREAAKKFEAGSAKYEWVEEKVLVREASTKKVEVPAVYETVTEKVLVRPAYTTWKKGRGLIERVDNSTGEIMCRVEVPAEYKEVKRRVVKTPATTKTVDVPAETKVVKVRKLVSPATEKRIEIPKETRIVKQRQKVADEKLVWRSVLCETNATPGMVTDIQRALKTAGYDPGPIDGRIGRQTLAAIDSYQTKKGLARGGLTKSTLDSLGIRLKTN